MNTSLCVVHEALLVTQPHGFVISKALSAIRKDDFLMEKLLFTLRKKF